MGTRRGLRRPMAVLLAGIVTANPAPAFQPVDIADVPIVGGARSLVKPNLLVTLDDSGSMRSAYMPDNLLDTEAFLKNIDYAPNCNTLYYRPGTPYAIPPAADDPSRTITDDVDPGAAPVDGFAWAAGDRSAGTVNLYSQFRLTARERSRPSTPMVVEHTGRRAFYVTAAGGGPADCVPFSAGESTRQVVDVADADMRNFAIWFSFYRTRLLAMKSALGISLGGLQNNIRTGFVTINPVADYANAERDSAGVLDSKYLKIADYTPEHRGAFLAKLYSQGAAGNTPLHLALSRAGRHFAGRTDRINKGMPEDPVEYACQRNYTLLTTDGAWTYPNGYETWSGEQLGYGIDLEPILQEDNDAFLAKPLNDTFAEERRWSYIGTSAGDWMIAEQRYVGYCPGGTPGELSEPKTFPAGAVDGYPGVVFPALSCPGVERQKSFLGLKVETASLSLEGRPKGYGDAIPYQYRGNLYYSSKRTLDLNGAGAMQVQCRVNEPFAVVKYTGGGVDDPERRYYRECASTPVATTYTTVPVTQIHADDQNILNTTDALSDPLGVEELRTKSDAQVQVANAKSGADGWAAGAGGVYKARPSAAKSTSRTLADVAMYYYRKNLRTATLGNATSRTSGKSLALADPTQAEIASVTDVASHQRMMTFTLGFGVPGLLPFDPYYERATSGPYRDLIDSVNEKGWVDPINGGSKIDDLWHAAVNGRGRYFAANDPNDVIEAVNLMISKITGRQGAGAGAAVQRLEPVEGENAVYWAKFDSQSWSGDVVRATLDLADGSSTYGSLGTERVSAAARLAAKVDRAADTRKIYLQRGAKRIELTPTDLASNTAALSAAEKAHLFIADSGADLGRFGRNTGGNRSRDDFIYWLRGQYRHEARASVDATDRRFRVRETPFVTAGAGTEVAAPLGDFVGSNPVFVAGKPFKYGEGYTDWTPTAAAGTVYVGGNDGMLHAFNAADMSERWAVVPEQVLPQLKRLAQRDYLQNHRFLVDGTPRVHDVKDANGWRRILVAGLGAGLAGYFAIDVTDETTPVPLWTFSAGAAAGSTAGRLLDPDLGRSVGEPIVTRRPDGRWVAVVTSGYRNESGRGVLYVLDAVSGELLTRHDTGVSPGADESEVGLARVSGFTEDTRANNTTRHVYGGDLRGNVWRFDLGAETGTAPFKLASLADADGKVQAITTAPEIGRRGGKRVVVVTTGKFLGMTDLPDLSVATVPPPPHKNSVFVIVDSDERMDRSKIATCTLEATEAGAKRRSSCTGSSGNGWVVDLPAAHERIVVAPVLQLGVITFVSSSFSGDACKLGGDSYLHYLDFATGANAAGGASAAKKLDGGLSAGYTLVKLPSGEMRALEISADGEAHTHRIDTVSAQGTAKRVSWRELVR